MRAIYQRRNAAMWANVEVGPRLRAGLAAARTAHAAMSPKALSDASIRMLRTKARNKWEAKQREVERRRREDATWERLE